MQQQHTEARDWLDRHVPVVGRQGDIELVDKAAFEKVVADSPRWRAPRPPVPCLPGDPGTAATPQGAAADQRQRPGGGGAGRDGERLIDACAVRGMSDRMPTLIRK